MSSCLEPREPVPAYWEEEKKGGRLGASHSQRGQYTIQRQGGGMHTLLVNRSSRGRTETQIFALQLMTAIHPQSSMLLCRCPTC